jgi:hypothetical protein
MKRWGGLSLPRNSFSAPPLSEAFRYGQHLTTITVFFNLAHDCFQFIIRPSLDASRVVVKSFRVRYRPHRGDTSHLAAEGLTA